MSAQLNLIRRVEWNELQHTLRKEYKLVFNGNKINFDFVQVS